MRFDSLLIHRCTLIRSGVVTGKDPYGRDIFSDVPAENVACRVDQITRRVSNDPNGNDVIIQNVLFLSADAEVSDGMTIQDIRDLQGNAVLDGRYGVEDINPVYGKIRLHHYELTLQKE